MSVEIKTKGIKSNIRFLEDLITSLDGDLQEALHNLGEAIVSEARSNLQNDTHVYTGELNASINILEEGDKYIIVGSDLPYAGYIEYGRGPVRPVNAKFLHYFTKDGKEIFSKYSKATEPSPFLEPAVITETFGFRDIVTEKVLDKPAPELEND